MSLVCIDMLKVLSVLFTGAAYTLTSIPTKTGWCKHQAMIRWRAPTLLLHHEYSGDTCAATDYIHQYTVQSTKAVHSIQESQ